MFVTGDYDLSLSLKYKEPVKAVFKEKIFGHDHTFKTKMCYTQKDTMKDLSWKELDGAYYSKGDRQGNPAAFGNFTRSSMSVDQKRICSSPKVFNWLQEQQVMFPCFQQRYSNPQIRPTHYLDHIDRGNLNKRNGFFNSLENSITKNHYHHGGVAHHSGEVNLSLSIGRNNMKATVSTKTFDHIIDLEESDDTKDSNAGLYPQSPMNSTRVSYSGYKRDYQCTHSFTNNTTDNSFDGIGTTGNYFVPNDSTSCLKQNPLAEGVEQCEKPLLSGDISGKGKVLFSDERAFLDLNKSIFDDSFHFDEPSLTCSSSKAFSRESHRLTGETRESTFPTASNRREQDDDNPNETSDIAPQRILSSVTGYERTKDVGVEQFLINLNHPLSDSSENPGSLTTDNVDQVSSTRENKSKKAKHDPMSSPDYKTQDFVKVSGPDRSLSSCKSSCFEDISSGIETTMQSGTQLKNSNTKKSETLQANISPRQEDVDSSSNSDHQMGETSEVVDGQIIRGAVSLIYLALECSEPTVAINMNKIEDDQNTEQPQCSSDTFEEMVLKQPESSIDDCCVTSNAFEFNATERKDYGITLKRGRRMKDFQRDIMPSLSTLSRHEIYEDIKIMETALRSREYKRHRSKMTDGNKWINPVRNRRSRLNHVGRKYYS